MSAPRKKALHVGVIREGKFIGDRYFPEGGAVTVGENDRNTFPLPLARLPQTQPLFVHKDGRPTLVFTEAMKGKLHLRGRDLELSAARTEGLAKKENGLFELTLDESAKGRVTLGDVTFVFNLSPPPPPVPAA